MHQKKIISIVLACLMFFVSFQKIWVLTAFEINRDFIIANACVNKDKPKLQCNGKCQLTKQLKQTENQESTSNPRMIKIAPELPYILPLTFSIPTNTSFSQSYFVEIYLKSLFEGILSGVFHPPLV